jgi:hypothetical protein
MVRGHKRASNHACPAKIAVQREHAAAQSCETGRHEVDDDSIRPYGRRRLGAASIDRRFLEVEWLRQ